MGRSKPPAGSPSEGGETRRMILRVAQELFMTQGYRAVSTRHIADACGLTQPALYRHFANKQDLYVAMLREELRTVHAALMRVSARPGDIEERLRQAARCLPVIHYDPSQMLHDIAHELPPATRVIIQQEFHAMIIAPVAAIFAEGQAAGVVRGADAGGVDPVGATFLLFSMLQPAPRVEVSSRVALRRIDRAVAILLHGLLVARERTPDGHESPPS